MAWYTRLREERDEVGLWRGKRGYERKERNEVALFVWRCKRGCAATTKRRRCRGKNSKPVYMVVLCERHVFSAHLANRVDMLIRVSSETFDKIGTIQKRLAWSLCKMTRTNREMVQFLFLKMLINIILCGLAK